MKVIVALHYPGNKQQYIRMFKLDYQLQTALQVNNDKFFITDIVFQRGDWRQVCWRDISGRKSIVVSFSQEHSQEQSGWKDPSFIEHSADDES